MPDVPAAALLAAALAIHRAACPLRDDPDHDCARDAAGEEMLMPRALAALKAVLEVHQGVTDGDYPENLAICDEDGEFYPCPTVRAITAELAGDSESGPPQTEAERRAADEALEALRAKLAGEG